MSMCGSRCVVEDGHLKPCDALFRALEHGGRGKGILPIEVFSVSTGEFTRSGVALRSGDFAKRGIVLNYCPFCGADIGSHFAAANEKAEVMKA